MFGGRNAVQSVHGLAVNVRDLARGCVKAVSIRCSLSSLIVATSSAMSEPIVGSLSDLSSFSQFGFSATVSPRFLLMSNVLPLLGSIQTDALALCNFFRKFPTSPLAESLREPLTRLACELLRCSYP